MILRIFEGRVAATHAAEVHEAIRSTGLPELEQADGCISATFARTFDDDAEVILVVSVWKDWDSIAKWTKGNRDRPVFYQGKTELMDSATVRLLEVIDTVGAAVAVESALPDARGQ